MIAFVVTDIQPEINKLSPILCTFILHLRFCFSVNVCVVYDAVKVKIQYSDYIIIVALACCKRLSYLI